MTSEHSLEEAKESDNGLDLKLKALSSEFRRSLLGLIYAYGRMHPSDISKHVNIDSSHLAYHLELLVKASLINRVYAPREGAKFSQYSVTGDGKKFLDFIGVSGKLKESIIDESPTPRGYAIKRVEPSKTITKARGSTRGTFARRFGAKAKAKAKA